MSNKKQAKTSAEGTRIGVERFLQEKPQSKGTQAVLRAKHSMEAWPLAEWEKIVVRDMQTKIRG